MHIQLMVFKWKTWDKRISEKQGKRYRPSVQFSNYYLSASLVTVHYLRHQVHDSKWLILVVESTISHSAADFVQLYEKPKN